MKNPFLRFCNWVLDGSLCAVLVLLFLSLAQHFVESGFTLLGVCMVLLYLAVLIVAAYQTIRRLIVSVLDKRKDTTP